MGYNMNSGYGKATMEAVHNAFATGGKVFMVPKSAAAGSQILQYMFQGDPDGIVRYQATIQAAHDLCTAARNDVVLVASGHTETLATAGALTLSTSGVSVLGLGKGALKPVLTLSATGSTVAISGNNIAFKNIRLTPSVNS